MSERWLRALDECEIRLCDLPKGLLGECHWEDSVNGIIRINRSREIPLVVKLMTLLHECIHWIHPEWDGEAGEKLVLELEEKYFNTISPKALFRLMTALFPHLLGD